MDSLIIEKITSMVSAPWVFAAMGFHIVNAFMGAFMAFRKKSGPLIRIHGLLYCSVISCIACFLILNQIHAANGVWEYLIALYFITVIPISKRWDALTHAFFALVGLTLLPLLVLLQIF